MEFIMKIATYNTNSIRARMDIILSWLDVEKPDILCLQETKVQDKDFPMSQFKEIGYRAVFRGQKTYNGVAIISAVPLDEVRRNLYEEDDEQARFLSVRTSKLTVMNVYVPQGYAAGTEKFRYKLQWIKDLSLLVQRDYDPASPLLLAGDFNVAMEPIDLYDPDGLYGSVGFHPDEHEVMKKLFGWGFLDVFRQHHPEGGHYTFWDYRIPNAFKRKMGWRIDYILATRPLAEKSTKAWIDVNQRIGEKPSDHTFLVAEFDI